MSTLQDRLSEQNQFGLVIYASDFFHWTHWAFHEGVIDCCDSTTMRARRLSATEYIEELERLVEQDNHP